MVPIFGLKNPLPTMSIARAMKNETSNCSVINKWPMAMSEPPTITAARCPMNLSATMPPMNGVM